MEGIELPEMGSDGRGRRQQEAEIGEIAGKSTGPRWYRKLTPKGGRFFPGPRRRALACPPPSTTKILTWNCRGLCNKETLLALRGMTKKHQPQCIFLMETRGNRKRMEKTAKGVGYQNYFVVEPDGTAGGLLLLWTEEIDLRVCWSNKRIIRCDVSEQSGLREWAFFGVYGTPYGKEKTEFWNRLGEEVQNCEKPWLLMGDLNEVAAETEKFGGRPIWNRKLYLRDFIQSVGAVDLGYEGCKYTWDNGHGGNSFIRERLDRGLACHEWLLHFQKTRIFHLMREESDHVPILLSTNEVEARPRRPFRYLKAWSRDTTSFGVVENAWQRFNLVHKEAGKTIQKLFRTAQALKKWNKQHFGYSF